MTTILKIILYPFVYLVLFKTYYDILHTANINKISKVLNNIYNKSKQQATIDVKENRIIVTITHCDFCKKLGTTITKALCHIDYEFLNSLPYLTVEKNLQSTIACGGEKCVTVIDIKDS